STDRILGPAVPEYVARVGDVFWIIVSFEGQARWIRSDRLRSRRQFENQRVLKPVSVIKDLAQLIIGYKNRKVLAEPRHMRVAGARYRARHRLFFYTMGQNW